VPYGPKNLPGKNWHSYRGFFTLQGNSSRLGTFTGSVKGLVTLKPLAPLFSPVFERDNQSGVTIKQKWT